MAYRYIKSNSNEDILAAGWDESQSGDYNGVGSWLDYTTEDMIMVDGDLLGSATEIGFEGYILKWNGSAVVSKTYEEIASEV